nr:hypothetical protein GCM10017745_45630 [Saccharothrix mutabilis subsp. capreolus]
MGTRLLRSITIAVALGAFSSSAGLAVFVLYSHEVLGLGSFGYGLMMTAMAAGWVVSSFVVSRIVAKLGYSWSMRGAQIGLVVTQGLIAVLPPWPVAVAAVVLVQSVVVMVWNVCSQSSRQRLTPSGLLGRVLTGHRALAWGLLPLGALTGGVVASWAGLRSVWLVVAAIQLVALAVTWRGMSPREFAAATS